MAMFALIFGLFGVVMWAAAGVPVYFRQRQPSKTALMRRVETSSAAEAAGSAPGTLVEVKGTLRCESPITSGMAGQPCAYYLSRVIREYTETDRTADGDGHRRASPTRLTQARLDLVAGVEEAAGAEEHAPFGRKGDRPARGRFPGREYGPSGSTPKPHASPRPWAPSRDPARARREGRNLPPCKGGHGRPSLGGSNRRRSRTHRRRRHQSEK